MMFRLSNCMVLVMAVISLLSCRNGPEWGWCRRDAPEASLIAKAKSITTYVIDSE